jgi:hypothetical protein
VRNFLLSILEKWKVSRSLFLPFAFCLLPFAFFPIGIVSSSSKVKSVSRKVSPTYQTDYAAPAAGQGTGISFAVGTVN